MRFPLKILATSLVFALVFSACANLTERQEHIDSVISSQIDVLKKTKAQREQSEIKSRIAKDSVLAEKERILMDALSSVIDSQESYLKLKNKIESKRGNNEFRE